MSNDRKGYEGMSDAEIKRRINELSQLFAHTTPTCEHDFQGWREFADGNGGETVCAKCGMGAMAWSIRTGI
jgi:hypothetical protein